MQKISKNVYVETGFRGCNVSFVVTAEGLVMVETPMVPSESIRWRDEMAKYGTLRYLINNEPHYDHMAGNCFFGGLSIVHEGAREEILNASVEQLEMRLKRMAPAEVPLGKGFHFRAPDITISQNLTLYLGEHTFQLLTLPGHTPFQLAVYVPEERVVFTSDNVVNQSAPYLHQSVPYTWLESLEKIRQLEVDWVVPGHGAICDRSYLPTMSATVRNWINKVNTAMQNGWSLEEAQNRLSLESLFPGLPVNDMMNEIKRNNLARLFKVLKK